MGLVNQRISRFAPGDHVAVSGLDRDFRLGQPVGNRAQMLTNVKQFIERFVSPDDAPSLLECDFGNRHRRRDQQQLRLGALVDQTGHNDDRRRDG